MSFRTSLFSIFLALVGCSDPPSDTHASNQAAAGGHASANGGSSGGMSGSLGSAGSAMAGAGPSSVLSGSGGTGTGIPIGVAGGGNGGGRAQTISTGGTGGTGGTSSMAGSSGGGGAPSRGPAPTFTMIYDTIITPSCGGTQCHLKRPTPFGYDFSSKSAASASWHSDVIAGQGEASPMFQVLNFGIMPKDKPVLSIDSLYMVLDWINAGALDN